MNQRTKHRQTAEGNDAQICSGKNDFNTKWNIFISLYETGHRSDKQPDADDDDLSDFDRPFLLQIQICDGVNYGQIVLHTCQSVTEHLPNKYKSQQTKAP